MNTRRFWLVTTLLLAIFGATTGFGWTPWVSQAMAARGASPEESARARKLFEQHARSEGAPRTIAPQNNAVTLAPGASVTFEYKGYCLDQKFAAPVKGEPLTFRPASNYIAPQLRGLYTQVMRQAGKGASSKADVQKIVWAMRSPATGSWTEGLTATERQFLNAAMPGGAALLQTASRPPEFLGSQSGSANRSGGGRNAGGLETLLPHLMKQLPVNVRQHSDGLMRQLLNAKPQNPMPSEQSSYSMLTDTGVAGKALGRGGLTVNAVVLNASNQPFTLDVTQWVLESSRDVQAVALPQPGTIRGQGDVSVSAAGTKQPSTPQKKRNAPQDLENSFTDQRP